MSRLLFKFLILTFCSVSFTVTYPKTFNPRPYRGRIVTPDTAVVEKSKDQLKAKEEVKEDGKLLKEEGQLKEEGYDYEEEAGKKVEGENLKGEKKHEVKKGDAYGKGIADHKGIDKEKGLEIGKEELEIGKEKELEKGLEIGKEKGFEKGHDEIGEGKGFDKFGGSKGFEKGLDIEKAKEKGKGFKEFGGFGEGKDEGFKGSEVDIKPEKIPEYKPFIPPIPKRPFGIPAKPFPHPIVPKPRLVCVPVSTIKHTGLPIQKGYHYQYNYKKNGGQKDFVQSVGGFDQFKQTEHFGGGFVKQPSLVKVHQPVYIRQPYVIKHKPVIKEKEVVTIEKGNPIIADKEKGLGSSGFKGGFDKFEQSKLY